MTVVAPAIFWMRSGLRGNSAVKCASWATNRYPAAGRGADGETAGTITVAAIEPASRTIPATSTERRRPPAVQAPRAAASLGHGDPVFLGVSVSGVTAADSRELPASTVMASRPLTR